MKAEPCLLLNSSNAAQETVRGQRRGFLQVFRGVHRQMSCQDHRGPCPRRHLHQLRPKKKDTQVFFDLNYKRIKISFNKGMGKKRSDYKIKYKYG